MKIAPQLPAGVEILHDITPELAPILAVPALTFVAKLSRKFEQRRRELLAHRARRQAEFDAGRMPDFLPQTKAIRESEWKVAPAPHDLQDRRVEITGPTDRKMVINALNSGANVFMADFEDSNTPTWSNMIEGQINLRDTVRRSIDFVSPEGKTYQLDPHIAMLFVRPRSWHLPEKHVLVDGEAVSGAIFDFGLYFFHNARELLAAKSGPYFYLPKMESHLEARLWNDIFVAAQLELGIPVGTIKSDQTANAVAIEKVRADKLREATDGCDGTWVAHPGLVEAAKAVFDEHMPGPNQIHRQRDDVHVTAPDLLDFQPEQPITDAGLRNNVSVGIQYIGAWLAGNGCVPVYDLMEDAATAEIARSQIWQWMRSPKGVLDDGRKVTKALIRQLIPAELAKVRSLLGDDAWRAGDYEEAAQMFDEITTSEAYVEFLTLPGYERLTRELAQTAQPVS